MLSANPEHLLRASFQCSGIRRRNRWKFDLGNGDWNLDGDFTTSDLVVAFQDGGFEKGPQVTAAIVPEPASPLAITMFVVVLLLARRNVFLNGAV
ncbi:MAG: hypothetical protein KDB27_14170 [Planctomycetales bacterium]|nr:hypothetical protein [Planctomycetales bacterium]